MRVVNKVVTEITEQNFNDEVLKSDLLVFSCFTAHWCHSCYPTCLIADELARQYEGKIKFIKVDTEKCPEISARYHVRALPSIVIFQNSQVEKVLPGYQEKASLRDLLDALVAGGEPA